MSGFWSRQQWLRPLPTMDVMSGLTAAVLLTAATALTAGGDSTAAGVRALDPLGYLLVAAAGGALAWRTRAPTATFAVTLALGVAYQGAAYPGGPDPLPVIVALYTIAARGSRQRALGLSLLATVALVGARAIAGPAVIDSPLLIAFPTAVVAALYAGQIVANRRAAQVEVAQVAAAADRERERDTERRVAGERLRIARELHDVVAHNISLINVQATMGVHLMSEQPSEAAAALAAIKTASKQALRELRYILDVLRESDDNEPTSPAPGLGQLDALITSTRQAGLPIQVTTSGTRQQLPATVDVAAYRILQESLTNALRYAAPATAQVTVDYGPGTLSLTVSDEGTTSTSTTSTGHGIAGMRERAAAVGGTLHAGPRQPHGFTVRAELPLTAAQP